MSVNAQWALALVHVLGFLFWTRYMVRLMEGMAFHEDQRRARAAYLGGYVAVLVLASVTVWRVMDAYSATLT